MRTSCIILLLALISTITMAQTNYDTGWKKVEAAMNKGLPKTALEEVEKIYTLAKKEKAGAQQVKALVYKSQLVRQVEENDWFKNIQSMELESSTAAEPVKQILFSISADLYWSYFQANRWKLYNRTNTINFKKDDPETWTTTDFHEKITTLYEKSLSNAKLLQQTKLDQYEPVILKGNMRALRPTLYDLLAFKALDYFKQDERNITKPAYAFQLNDQASLAPAKTFIRHTYTSKDSSSNELAAIKLFQDIIRFHIEDNDKAAYLDADIARLQYAFDKSVNEGRDQLYKEGLEHIYNTYNSSQWAMQAGYLLAGWWRTKGDAYNAATGTQTGKMALAEAIRVAKEVAAKFPNSEGGTNAAVLAKELEKPSLNLQTEKVNVPGSPFRSLVQFKNINNIYLRVVKADDRVAAALNRDYNDNVTYWKTITAFAPLTRWQQALPAMHDYRTHNAEIKVDALPVGKYLLIASGDEKFTVGNNPMSVTTFYVSNISFVNSGNDYFILHRSTGKPLAGATAQVWESYYDYNTRKQVNQKTELLTADKNGYTKRTKTDNTRNANIKLEIKHGTDYLFIDEQFYAYDRNNDVAQPRTEEELAHFFVFADRSIYRPGQTVYFKAIAVTKDPVTGKSKLYLTPQKLLAQLMDANYQKLDSLKLSVNEFGSINGQFKLPQTGLTGIFRIEVGSTPRNKTAVTFNVEEYKRPKFYVEYESIKESFKVNDDVKVTGVAKAYAGNNIDGATVKYRVYRSTRFLYPWLFWKRGIWPPYGNEEKMEITNGETNTDASGKFIISFKAIPDLGVDKTLDPSFDYTIEADVLDLNGETRSGTETVSVGYKSLLLTIAVPGGMVQHADSLKTISLTAANLAGEPQTTKATVQIFSLQQPGRLLRKRYWEAPDTTAMSYAEFIKYFPNDPYRNEDDYKNWQKGQLVKQDTITAGSNTAFSLAGTKLAPGYYMVEVTAKDKDGNEVKAVEYIAVYSNVNMPSSEYNFTQQLQSLVEPGESARFAQASGAADIYLVEETIKKAGTAGFDDKRSFAYPLLTTTPAVISYPATEADRGGYTVNRFFVKDNRVYTATWAVTVPWTNKDLKISFETFRDKLLPGQQEEWKVKISGYKGDAVAAEMLASMYDASLDQFKPHSWNALNLWQMNYFNSRWNGEYNFNAVNGTERSWYEENKWFVKTYDRLFTSGETNFDRRANYRATKMDMAAGNVVAESAVPMAAAPVQVADDFNSSRANRFKSAANKVSGDMDSDGVVDKMDVPVANPDNAAIQIRKNFNETAFFFPDLKTNEKGEITFSFTIPEALTQWKLQTLAHTKDLQTAMATRTIVTQKQLMVQPNAPRFFRQGDNLELVTKISNLTNKEITGQAQLQLFNTATMQPVDGWFKNVFPNQYFTVPAGQSVAVKFPMEVPYLYNDALTYRIVAKAADASDGEEMALPVLTNRMLVTESFPLNVRNTNNKNFTWEKLIASGKSTTAQNQSLTVEYTSNPAWYAVQALPYLMEYPYECAEQTWSRFYANALASKIANSVPKIKAVFEQWKNADTAALLSNLEKNQELKAVLLEETPWVLDAKNESQQKRNIALLFDMVRMSNEADKAIAKLKEMQSSNGGFVWFKGGPDDRYITQHIITGLGHLRKLDAWPARQNAALSAIAAKALPYLDARLLEEYNNLIRYKADLKKNNLSSSAIQYLYMRSFFPETNVAANAMVAYNYYSGQAKQFWLSQGKYEQGMIALALHRKKDMVTPKAILKSLTENSITNEEFGMYWKEFNNGGYYWWQAPIESQALLIEAYSEIENNTTRVNDLKTWLLKQKQTQNWKTTKATAEACYALLLQGSNWLAAEQNVEIKLGNTIFKADKSEAGTGYFKQKIDGPAVKPDMGNINVKITPATTTTAQPITSWGSVYWQYFEDMDKITPANTPLQLSKKLFIEKNSDRGPVLQPVTESTPIKVGDKIKVRIELRVDRNLEYVHLKDMRASCFEPVNVLSQYKYQGGLGYYEATRDASTNFFISYMSKGTYVFEYSLLTTHAGNFSNGITSIQCMYAPEFSSHSEGIRVKVQ